jgi:hypothetical protein
MDDYVYRNMAQLHFAWVGACCSGPPPPCWVEYVCAPFGLHGTDVEKPYINNIISVSILSMDFKYNFKSLLWN